MTVRVAGVFFFVFFDLTALTSVDELTVGAAVALMSAEDVATLESCLDEKSKTRVEGNIPCVASGNHGRHSRCGEEKYFQTHGCW